MPSQKILKQRVRARMAKTGEAYTAARRQILRKADGGPGAAELATETPATEPAAADAPTAPAKANASPTAGPTAGEPMTSDEAMRRATGRGHAEWYTILDAWQATERTHTEIAAWLKDVQRAPSWWNQNITVSYERARGMRAPHEMANGFSISVTRTVAVEPDRVIAAFTDDALRERWLPDNRMRRRPTRARFTSRFDWPDPSSRVVVTVVPKDPGRSLVAVSHERLPDATAASTEKAAWRQRLAALKTVLEQ